MKIRINLVAFCLVALLSTVAYAQQEIRVAVASPSRIFNEMQERIDLRAKLDSERKLMEGMNNEKLQRIRQVQTTLQTLRPGTPQHRERSDELSRLSIEHRAWAEITDLSLQREQKSLIKSLYEKVEQATAEVAQQRGFHLVIADQRQPLPEDLDRVNVEQLVNMINARTILYASPAIDISNDVLALLDKRYREREAN